MEASYLPLDLTSIDSLQLSLKDLDESMPRIDNKVHLHYGTNSVAIRGKPTSHSNGHNGVIKPSKTLVDLVREEWRPYEEPFAAHPLLQSGHLQTFYAAFSNFNDVDRVHYARKLLTMADGGTVGLDFVLDSEEQYIKGLQVDEEIKQRKDFVENLPPLIRYMKADEEAELLQSDDHRPMLVLLHGLSGGSHESYLRAVVRHVMDSSRPWAACSLNSRGCGRTNITTQQLFCADWTSDLRETMNFLRKSFPNRRFYAVGFSLGANILCNYLGEEGADTPFVAACSVSNPWQLRITAEQLTKTYLGKELYCNVMGRNLKRVFMRQYPIMKGHPKIDWAALKKAKYIYEFDTAVTAPCFGHPTLEHYYESASSVLRLPKIKTPLLVLHALDDPIATEKALPWDEFADNEYTILAYTHRGGHLGWFMWGGKRWFVTAVADFFDLIEKTVTST